MKNQLRNLVTSLGLTFVLGTSFAYSQTQVGVATIPFAFHIQQKDLPAGRYQLLPGSTNYRGVVQIRNMKTGKSMWVIGHAEKLAAAASPKLVFHRYGNEYFFSQYVTGDAVRIEVVRSTREKEWASGGRLMAVAEVQTKR